MSSLVQASFVATGQVQSLDSVRTHALPSDALIFASPNLVTPTNQNTGSYAIVESAGATALTNNVVTAVTQSPFADLYKEGSMYFPGSVNSNIFCTTGSYAIGSGLTAECWVNYTSFAGSTNSVAVSPTTILMPVALGAMGPSSVATAWSLGTNSTGNVVFYYYSSSSQSVTSITQLSTNTWNHIAATVSGGNIFVFINGVQTQVSANRNGTLQTAAYYEPVQGTPGTYGYAGVGATGTAYTTGYIADARIVSGSAVYTGSTSSYASFTVPSAPLSPASSGVTQALIRAGQNSPTIQSGALTFDRGLKQYMNFGPQTFNLATQGFTAVCRVKLSGTIPSYERIFEFASAVTNASGANAISLWLDTGAFVFRHQQVSTTTYTSAFGPGGAGSGIIVAGQTYVVTTRYDPVSQTMTVWVNGIAGTPQTLTTANAVDRTLTYTIVGQAISSISGSYVNDPYGFALNGTMNTFAVYNRALSNVEIYNSYLALTTTPVGRTLEIGDINGTPALSVAGDGKVSVQSIGLSSNVVPWPPAAMTGYDTVINGQVYKARASGENGSQYAWLAFDQNSSTYWLGSGTYNSTTGFYTGTASTTDVNGTVYSGEWCQIQLPTPVLPVSFYNLSTSSAPNSWVVLGSRDGVNFSLIQTVTNDPGGGRTNTASSVNSFLYFRWVIIKSTVGIATPSFFTLQVNGTADTSPSLTIAPATTFNTSVATPSLTGVAAPGVYVPQDFSSSGLNIPAYVVSNTATVANTVAFSSFGPFAGEGSFQFGGGKGGYIAFPYGTPPNFNLSSTSVCTFEFWFYPTWASGTSTEIISHASPTSGSYDWTLYVTGGNLLGYYNGSVGPNSTNQINFNAWNHGSFSFTGGTVYIGLNGFVNSGSFGTPAFTTTYSLSIGSFVGAGANFNGYLSGVRIVSGQALYTTTFTPPTQSLQPIQGTTQAGLPYGTVLLLRNAPAPGRIQTTKFSGANSLGPSGSAAVLSFPPAAMTGYSTSLNAGYGQGTYVASASTESSTYYAWTAFDKSASTFWSSGYSYTTNAPYGGTVRTVDVNGTSYAGEWLQIQKPSSIVLSNYALLTQSGAVNTPGAWYVLGSRDGTNWFLVDQRSGATWTAGVYNTYQVQSSQAFNYFRIVVNVVSTNTGLSIAEWTLNGSIESVNVTADGRVGLGVVNPTRALEVAGDVVCAGTLSAGNPLMFRNRFINGDMRVWQRGTTFSSVSASTYTADRWCTAGNAQALTVAQSIDTPLYGGFQNSLSITTTYTSGSTALLEQRLERVSSLDLYKGTTFVISFWAKQTAGTANSLNVTPLFPSGVETGYNSGTTATTPQTQAATLSSAWTYYTFPFAVSSASVVTNGLYVQFWWAGAPSNPSTVLITGVQLEKGSVATPFEVRPYATELALCQRYFYQVTSPSGASGGPTNPWVAWAWADASTTSQALVQLPVPMRTWANTASQISVSGAVQLINAVSAVTVSSLGMTYTDGSTTQMARFTFGAVTGTLIVGAAYGIRLNGAGSSISISAEL